MIRRKSKTERKRRKRVKTKQKETERQTGKQTETEDNHLRNKQMKNRTLKQKGRPDCKRIIRDSAGFLISTDQQLGHARACDRDWNNEQ